MDSTGQSKSSYIFSNTAEVLVGSAKLKFTIHPDILLERSSFFKAALSKRWTPQSKVIELPEDDAGTFDRYLSWVYFGKDTKATSSGDLFSNLILTYILAEKLGDLVTCNCVIDEVIRVSDENDLIPSRTCVQVAFEHTPVSSPLRRFMVDLYIHEAGHSVFNEIDGSAPHEFLVAIAKEFKKLKGQPAVSDPVRRVFNARPTARCHYHQHDDSHPKCS